MNPSGTFLGRGISSEWDASKYLKLYQIKSHCNEKYEYALFIKRMYFFAPLIFTT